ncbi:hypothetical protein [Nocardia jiangxiensis]|uniref:Uncharacterized protein n=1 Tax=Nocardia jiangxiensis TaxID=282685 RepID=A0ABW6SCJ3_9NOCA|nr:hypothetical protein [Nocardia jiangxiensis]
MQEPIEQLPQDDWVDQDLLTKDLARSLLDGEIAAERDRLVRIDRGETPADAIASRADLQRRLDAMVAARDRLRHSRDL